MKTILIELIEDYDYLFNAYKEAKNDRSLKNLSEIIFDSEKNSIDLMENLLEYNLDLDTAFIISLKLLKEYGLV